MTKKSFVQAEYIFSHRGIYFIATKREALENPEIFKAVFVEGISDEERQNRAQALVEHFRPELKGCVVYALQYSLSGGYWEMAVTHASLPENKPGERLPKEHLIPDSWREREPLL